MRKRIMSEEDTTEKRAWLEAQVAAYEDECPHYVCYAELLEEILKRAARELAPLAIVQSRPKSIASFAEKALRKYHKYRDPVHQLTDLCGARIIARTRSEVEAMSGFLEAHFDIDWSNSLDCSQRLGPAEFGYRSVHYIVEFRSDRSREYGTEIPEIILGKKAEVQVRTVVEHAYADFAHDLSYKGAFQLPIQWQRELAGVAAALEEADQTFSRIEERLTEYATAYGAYLEEEELGREIAFLDIVREHDPGNADLAVRIAKLAHRIGDWGKAEEVLAPFVDPEEPSEAPQPVLRELGITLCKKYPQEEPEYELGQAYLELASRSEHGDVDAVCSLAGTWKNIDETKVRETYQRAFEMDPHDTYALGCYLEHELPHNPGVVAATRPLLQLAVQRCQAQATATVNLPWAYFDLGKFHLLTGNPYACLDAYCKAVSMSTASFMIETSLASLERLGSVTEQYAGYRWAVRLLRLGLAAHFPSPERTARVEEMATKGFEFQEPNAIIVAGGTDPRIEDRMKGYAKDLCTALEAFRGTVISGGTTQGISGLVGNAARFHGGRFRTVGYLPRAILESEPEDLPEDATPDLDQDRYYKLWPTEGGGFSPLEPLQNWIDLLASGVMPSQVRVFGIGGGAIAGTEYRIAAALGAHVGIIEGSGREAERIFTDAFWASVPTLLMLPPDAHVMRAFADWGGPQMDEDLCERLAKAIHEEYRRERFEAGDPGDAAVAGWDSLAPDLQESNRAQARHIPKKLEALGLAMTKAGAPMGRKVRFNKGQIERLARIEHGRWVVERLLDGWRKGDVKDLERKTNPSLAAWGELSDGVQDYDRQTVEKIPTFLRIIKRGIRPLKPGEPA
jgi:ppGpp synthetase/RelA/SpoT-type nucleotidyltranferase